MRDLNDSRALPLVLALLGALSLPPAAAGQSATPAAPAAAPAEAPSDAPPADVAAPPADAEKTASGLASKVLREGTGGVRPDGNDLVSVHFTAWTPAGAKFQSSYDRGQPAVFDLNEVFPGWREGLQLMVVGEKRRLWIPEHLTPQKPRSGPTGAMTFDVELLGIRVVPDPPATLDPPPPDAERTISGAFSRRIQAGTGTVKPGPDSLVLLSYTGWTTDGKTFDSTARRGRPTAFPLPKVMPAFADIVQLMVEGEKRQIWIPGNVAGGQWLGSPQGTLVFEVELLRILPDDALQQAVPVPEGSG